MGVRFWIVTGNSNSWLKPAEPFQTRINTGRQDGSLNRHEFYSVQRRLNDIKRDVVRERYQDGGQLSGPDRQRLEGRLDQLNDSIRWARHNDNQRPW